MKRAWVKWLLLLFGMFIAIVLLLFLWQTFSYYKKIRSGEITLDQFGKSTAQSQLSSSLASNSLTSATQTSESDGGSSDDANSVNNFADDPSYGPANARVTVVAFEDFQCPFCGQVYQDFRAAMLKYGSQVHFVYRDFPLSDIHPEAQLAAEAGQCANEQGKFWEYHDTLFANQNDLSEEALRTYAGTVGVNTLAFDKCLDSGKYTKEVQDDFADGVHAGVQGTPTFFFNGYKVAGVITAEGFDEIFTYLLSNTRP